MRSNSDGTNLGYDRINNLTAKLKEAEQKTKELSLDIKSMQRINTEQYSELERIEDTKGYSSKIDQLLSELSVVNTRNKEIQESIH